MPIQDIIVTILVLFGVFLLAYSAIRKQGMRETFQEMRDIFSEKAEEINIAETTYANA